MYLISSSVTNPYFNIATEEYFLKESSDDILFFYVNDSAVIVGKHQNALAEINIRFATENNIPVIRRISGGGAVYHDYGNLNFTFISNGKEGNLVDFRKFTKPIIEVLQKLGVEARFEGKNDIRVNGLKISGNAEHVHRNRVLHHGTLLISSDLNKLSASLKTVSEKYKDKAIKSVRSKVVNINDFLQTSIDIKELQKKIYEHVNQLKDSREYFITANDALNIEKLVDEKYGTWEWNFGYSPPYEFFNTTTINNKVAKIVLTVDKGIIIHALIKGFKEIQESITGKRHLHPEIYEVLKNLKFSDVSDLEELTWSFF